MSPTFTDAERDLRDITDRRWVHSQALWLSITFSLEDTDRLLRISLWAKNQSRDLEGLPPLEPPA